MAIVVVKRGQPPSEKVYEVECRSCRSLLKFKQSDATMNWPGDQRDGPFVQVTCPVCSATVTAYP